MRGAREGMDLSGFIPVYVEEVESSFLMPK